MNFNTYRDLVKYAYLNKFPWLRDYSCTRDIAFTFKPYPSYPGTMEIYLKFTYGEGFPYPWIVLYKQNNLQPLDLSGHFDSINKSIQDDIIFNLDILTPTKKAYIHNLLPSLSSFENMKSAKDLLLEEKDRQYSKYVNRIRKEREESWK